MSLLPQTKSSLREYLERVDELVSTRKGKLPYFEDKEVRTLLNHGHGEAVAWTLTAKREFRDMQKITGLPFHGQFGGDLWQKDNLLGYTEFSKVESDGGTRRTVVSYVHSRDGIAKHGGEDGQVPGERGGQDDEVPREDGEEDDHIRSEDSCEFFECRPSFWNFDCNEDVEFSDIE